MAYTTSVGMLDEVRKRSDAGCDRFYRTYRPLVRMHGRDCGISEADLDDLVQIVMAEFFRDGRFVYDSGKGRFRAYLRHIVRARSMDMLRRKCRERKRAGLAGTDEEFVDPRYDDEWRTFIRGEALKDLCDTVGPKKFQLFRMLVMEHRSVRETAEFLHAPEATVYSTFRRTRQVLEKIVRRLEHEAY